MLKNNLCFYLNLLYINIMDKKTLKLLKKIKFKKKFLSDKSGWWLERKVKHKILKGLKITIEKNTIILSCKDYEYLDKRTRSIVDIYMCDFTFKNLNKILEEFDG